MISLWIVEDDRVFREGLVAVFDAEPGVRCAVRCDSVEAALVAAGTPDVILLDIHLPGMLGSDGVLALGAKFPAAAILMLTVYQDADKVFESICNGARGYLLKKTPAVRLVEYVHAAHEGGAPMSPEIAKHVLHAFRATRPPRATSTLTPREQRLLGLLAEGHSYQTAAEMRGVTINTIRNHVRSVYEKLHVHTKSEAVAKAMRLGLV